MAKMSFEDIRSNDNRVYSNNSVGFFSLKNDGDVATVRIMHDTVDTFELLTTHPVVVDGKHRRVNCIRDARSPMEQCPLCASGNRVQQRFYIHLIQYITDEAGNVEAVPKVWERPASYAVTIKNFIEEYGNLSDYVLKIKRSGAAGSTDTKYDILVARQDMYPADQFVKEEALFNDYSAIGHALMDKDFNELSVFVNTGAFPAKSVNNSNTNNNNINVNTQTANANPTYQNNIPRGTVPTYGGNASATTGVTKPTRYY